MHVTGARTSISLLAYSIQLMQQSTAKQGVKPGVKQGVKPGVKQGVRQGVKPGVKPGVKQGVKQSVKQGVKQGVMQGVMQGVKQGVTQGVTQGKVRCSRLARGELNRGRLADHHLLVVDRGAQALKHCRYGLSTKQLRAVPQNPTKCCAIRDHCQHRAEAA